MTPFAPSNWPKGELRDAAEILWDWYRAAQHGESSLADPSQAHAVCREFHLPGSLVDAQMTERGVSPIQTVTELFDCMDTVAGSHALLLAKLAGYTANWIETPVKHFARAVFLTRSVCFLKEDILAGRHFIPLDALEKEGVSEADLREGRQTPQLRSLLWKQAVRARDAYASCRTLNSDLHGWCRKHFRICWTGGLDLLARIESRNFDVWSGPVKFTILHKTRVYLQAHIGKTTR